MIRSQSLDGSVVPKRRPAGWKRGTSSMPTDFSCRWMISNVRARSWLPAVVEKRKLTACRRPGTRRCRSFPALGAVGPAGAALALQDRDDLRLVEARTSAKCLAYPVSNGLKIRLWSFGRPGAIVAVERLAICVRFMP